MTSIDLDNDEFLQLLTDALRAGPASPEWHQAVARLRTQDNAQLEEYKLLLAAREDLESGKGYRAVRAGPGFTAKVLRSIEEESASGMKTPSMANLITGLSVVLILGVVLVLGYVLLRGGDAGKNNGQDLAGQVFTRTVLDTHFAGSVPDAWRTIGKLALDTKKDMMLTRGAGEKDSYLGGGVVTATPLGADETWAVDVELRPPAGADGIVQVFVSDQSDFSPEKGMSGHELQVMLRDRQLSVVTPDGREARQQALEKGVVQIRIAVGRDAAAVKLGDQHLWNGPHQLAADKPRWFGVRLLRKGTNPADTGVVQSIQLLKP